MRSDVIKKGAPAAPNRSLLYALGYTKEELERPLIGVVCSHNEIVPGHMNLDKIAEAVKAGVRAAGGTPVEFPAIAVCDGIAMGHVGMKYSLVTRDLIADSTEAMALAHQFDGLVMIPNCDKNVPGLLMAAARVNIPTIFVSGGPMLAGTMNDGRRTCLSHMFEAVGAYYAGKLDEEGLEEYENNACPTCGSCSGMYTANSMNCLTEAIGMGLRGNGTIPAVWSARLRLAKHAGMQIMDLVEKNIRPRDIMTEAAFHNAETIDMALGCSTNTMLHLPAIAHECGIELSFDMANEISQKTPNLCHLAPRRGHLYGGPGAGRRRVCRHGRAGPGGPAGHQPDDLHRQDRGREPGGCGEPQSRDHSPHRQPLLQDRRHRRAQGKPGPRRLRGEAVRRGPRDDGPPGPRPGVRL